MSRDFTRDESTKMTLHLKVTPQAQPVDGLVQGLPVLSGKGSYTLKLRVAGWERTLRRWQLLLFPDGLTS